MIFLPPEVKERSFPFGPVVGEEGFEPPTPWFVATCSNPLSYRPRLWICSREYPQKGNFLLLTG